VLKRVYKVVAGRNALCLLDIPCIPTLAVSIGALEEAFQSGLFSPRADVSGNLEDHENGSASEDQNASDNGCEDDF